MLNENELVSRLAELGYRSITLSNLSLTEQIATFAGASRVVSLHGAGLANFAFSMYGARLIEILPRTYGLPLFYIIASGLENDYVSYVADDVTEGRGLPRTDDVMIDNGCFFEKCAGFLCD